MPFQTGPRFIFHREIFDAEWHVPLLMGPITRAGKLRIWARLVDLMSNLANLPPTHSIVGWRSKWATDDSRCGVFCSARKITMVGKTKLAPFERQERDKKSRRSSFVFAILRNVWSEFRPLLCLENNNNNGFATSTILGLHCRLFMLCILRFERSLSNPGRAEQHPYQRAQSQFLARTVFPVWCSHFAGWWNRNWKTQF